MEEAMRRLRNMSIDLAWEDKVKHLNIFSLDLMESGYPQNFRKTTLERAVTRYEAEIKSHRMWELGEEGGRPIFRTGQERDLYKEGKSGYVTSDNWFRAGGYTSIVWVPATPGGLLAAQVEKALASSRAPQGTKTKVLQKGGRVASRQLMKTNAYPKAHCEREKCLLCWQTDGAGSTGRCWAGPCGYAGLCTRCPDEDYRSGTLPEKVRNAVYHGETSKTAYGRIKQHLDGYNSRLPGNWMWEHTKSEHSGVTEPGDYRFLVTGTFRDPTTRIADEAIRLKREELGKLHTGGGEGPVLILNTKNEFYPAKDVRVTFTQF